LVPYRLGSAEVSNVSNKISQVYLPTSRQFPEDTRDLTNILSKSYVETALAVNKRTIGTYNTFAANTGNLYYALNESVTQGIQFRQSYRQVYPFTTISAGATLTIVHGLTGVTQFVDIVWSVTSV